ncbi:MAG: hypothetical protein LBC02_05020 [Planctomycetaceae bacterium]|jgi:hypothetical protein|nr:hypothetical protein [Planctomycetaceae bacterium]
MIKAMMASGNEAQRSDRILGQFHAVTALRSRLPLRKNEVTLYHYGIVTSL